MKWCHGFCKLSWRRSRTWRGPNSTPSKRLAPWSAPASGQPYSPIYFFTLSSLSTISFTPEATVNFGTTMRLATSSLRSFANGEFGRGAFLALPSYASRSSRYTMRYCISWDHRDSYSATRTVFTLVAHHRTLLRTRSQRHLTSMGRLTSC